LISGLWHGAAWRFVIWGGINGVAAASNSHGSGHDQQSNTPGGESNFPGLKTLLRIWSTFAIICAAWIFFRAETFADAMLILEAIGRDFFSASAYQTVFDTLDQDKFMRTTVVLLLLFVLWEWFQRREECPLTLPAWPLPIRWSAYSATGWLTLLLMPQSGGQEFIYFAF
jgi:D-alanyl-lipoteichoic acid acyltransferase DltB (MBOAT superfamily)